MIAPYRERGIVLDIGTGDGRFVSSLAKANPDKFFIGIDANAKPLEKPSMKATRKPAKGGLPNAMFVQAAVEDLPEELNGIATHIHINFPWGSLLRAASTGDTDVLGSFRRISSQDCHLKVIIGIDPARDSGELERRCVEEINNEFDFDSLIKSYQAVRFRNIENREMTASEWARLDTSWARKLKGNEARKVFYFAFVQSSE